MEGTNRELTTPELELEESCALVHSLKGWRVVNTVLIENKASLGVTTSLLFLNWVESVWHNSEFAKFKQM